MEVFLSDRQPGEAVLLTVKLKALGLRGRDAAYLASLAPPGPADLSLLATYRADFRFMVDPEQRAAAAALIGLTEW